MMNPYRHQFPKLTPPGIKDSVNLGVPKQQDFQPPSVGGVPTRVSQAVVNFVIRTRGQRDPFTPFLNRNPLQRTFLTSNGTRRTRGMPKDVVLEGPDYDFREINKVLSVDGFAARAMNTLISASLNGRRGHGFFFESHSKSAKEYVERRLEEMTFVIKGEGSVPNIMRKIVTSFITKSNVILWLRRETRGDRKKYKWRGTERNPILGLEVIDPSMIDVARSPDTNAIVGFNLVTETFEDTIPITDCYLLRWEDMQQDNLFARPLIIPVLDDILTLRKLEEIHELAMAKATFPLIHVMVGDPKTAPQVFGVQNIDTEVHRAQNALEQAAPEGFLVTPGWYKLEVVQPKNTADFLPYMQYYRDRIIVGLNMDGVSMGIPDTANRSTAAQMSLQLMEKVREIRSAIADEISRTLVREILVEGGFSPIGESAVHMRWEDPDLESLMAWENHNLAMYQGGVFTLTESREACGKEPLSPDQEKDLFQYRVGQIESKFNPTVNQPTNQHKTSPSKPSRARKKDKVNLENDLIFDQAKMAILQYPASFKQILDTHLKIMHRRMFRFITDEADRSAVRERTAWIKKSMVEQFQPTMARSELGTLFDKHRMYIEGLSKIAKIPGESDDQGDGLHEGSAGEEIPPAGI